MTPSGIEPATFRFVAQHLNHCATAVPYCNKKEAEMFLLTSKEIVLVEINREVKVNFTLEQATKTHRGEWRYSSTLFLNLGAT